MNYNNKLNVIQTIGINVNHIYINNNYSYIINVDFV